MGKFGFFMGGKMKTEFMMFLSGTEVSIEITEDILRMVNNSSSSSKTKRKRRRGKKVDVTKLQNHMNTLLN